MSIEVMLFLMYSLFLGMISIYLILRPNRNVEDWFSPLRMFLYFHGLGLMMNFFIIHDISVIDPLVFSNPFIIDFEGTLVWTVFFSFCSFLFTVFALIGRPNKYLVAFFVKNASIYNEVRIKKSAPILIFCLGIFIWFLYIYYLGGFKFVILNLYRRVKITAGTGYFSSIWKNMLPASVFVCFFIKSFKKKTPFKALGAFMLVLFTFIPLISLGGRSAGVFFVFSCLLYANYYKKKLNILSPRLISVFFILLFLSLFIGFFRSNSYKEDVNFFRSTVKDQDVIGTIIRRASPLDRRLVMTGYYLNKEPWYGASFLDLFKAWIPRSLFPQKPPVDDGVYIFNIALGRDVRPPVPLDELVHNSWPPGNWIGLMNWGWLGLCLFSYLSGMFINALYSSFLSTKKHIFLFILYSSFISFGGVSFSNHGLVNVIMKIVLVHVAFALIYASSFLKWKIGKIS